ncbi:MAG: glycosyltransferase [Eubacterium sp.]|nr:glycosyltransferase [Eubacterium sp.]
MKILLAEIFASYTQKTIGEKLKKLGHEVIEKKYYTPEDNYKDERIVDMIKADIKSVGAECVFTVNIWPPVARACNMLRVPYVAWSYDSPQNLPSDEDLNYDTNFLYIFDRIEAEMYNERGIERVFHMPLAADTERWDKFSSNGNIYDISFLGSLYESTLPGLISGMSEYNRGYVNGAALAQQKIYGYFVIDEIIDDGLIKSISEDFKKANKKAGKDIFSENITKKQLAYSIASYVTYTDRLSLLRVLGSKFDMHLFSAVKEETRPLLSGISVHEYADYDTKMPIVFKNSKINLNPSLRIIRSGISLRCLDVMGCGGFLLSSYQPELAENFEDGKEIVLYTSIEDAVAKADFYLRNDELRESIAKAGYNKVKNEFTYESRLEKMLEKIKGS